MDSALAFASAVDLAKLVRERKVGCLELLDFHLNRVERLNGRINAVVARRFDEASRSA